MAMKKDADKTTSKKVEKISKKLKVFKSPSAFSVLFIIIAIMAGLTWLIPSGRYEQLEDGKIKSNSYSQTEKRLKVVEEVKNPKTEISISDAESKGFKNAASDFKKAEEEKKELFNNSRR